MCVYCVCFRFCEAPLADSLMCVVCVFADSLMCVVCVFLCVVCVCFFFFFFCEAPLADSLMCLLCVYLHISSEALVDKTISLL